MTPPSSYMPIQIRPGNLQSSPSIEAWARRKLTGVFRRYGAKLTTVEVHFDDVNGQKHDANDVRCLMEAQVPGRPPIAASGRGSDLYDAIARAARKLDAALSKVIERSDARRRRRSLRHRGRDAGVVAFSLQHDVPASSAGDPTTRRSDEPMDRRPRRVIIAGYGPVGRALANKLIRLQVPFTVVDSNPTTARTQESLGVPVTCGDVTDPAVLRTAGIETAAVIAITIPDGDDAVRACATARSLAPGVHIAARTTFLSQGLGALRAGANSITVEEIATAEAMARTVSQQIASYGVGTDEESQSEWSSQPPAVREAEGSD